MNAARLLTAILVAVAMPTTALLAQTGRDVGVYARTDQRPVARRLALVVGCDQYESLPALQYAERDADDVGKELEAIGFRVVRMRVGGPVDEPKPLTGGAILNQVEKLCRQTEGEGTLLFYFSGHGFETADGHVYLCPFGTDASRLSSTGLDLEDVHKRLLGSGCKQRLLIVDMCRKQKDKSIAERDLTLQRFQQAQGTGLLFSTAPGSLSFEPEPGMKDEVGTLLQNGLFTHYLLRGLRGEADRGRRAQRDGFVTFREVAYFVSDGLADLSLAHRALDQRPYLRWDGTAEDVLLRVLPEPAVSASAPVTAPAPRPEAPVSGKPEVDARSVSSWAEVLRAEVDPAVVTDASARAKIAASGWPWRVKDKKSGIEMVLIPAGEFLMGTKGNAEGERQHHRVIKKPFYLGETEVTQAQWRRVMGENPSDYPGEDRPVECVSWDMVQAFLKRTGMSLPSEAQWEYACRAGTTTEYWFGDRVADGRGKGSFFGLATQAAKGWPWDVWPFDDSYDETAPVRSFAANAWGLFDMHGNVWEWCADGYEKDYPGDSADEAPAAGVLRVVRGGAWNTPPSGCRAAYRWYGKPALRDDYFGFRAARTP